MLTQARLKELLHYDPASGVWTWLKRTGSRNSAGRQAGRLDQLGYRGIQLDGRRYLSSRLAVFYMTGEWPPDEVDHKDGNPSNDRWNNLRPATHAQNCLNKSMHSRNTSGFTGVSWHKGMRAWGARVTFKGREYQLGWYPTREAAGEAAKAGRLRIFGEFARGA
jgi:hypothetical protein